MSYPGGLTVEREPVDASSGHVLTGRTIGGHFELSKWTDIRTLGRMSRSSWNFTTAIL